MRKEDVALGNNCDNIISVRLEFARELYVLTLRDSLEDSMMNVLRKYEAQWIGRRKKGCVRDGCEEGFM